MNITLYILSVVILFFAELCQTFHSIAIINNNKQLSAITGATSSALWCLKVVVIVNQPLTIFTAFLGAYFGSICAWNIQEKFATNN